MSRSYTHVQELLPSVLAMKGKGYTYRQIAKQFGLNAFIILHMRVGRVISPVADRFANVFNITT